MSSGDRIYSAILYIFRDLMPAIQDSSVTDIHCNSDGQVWVKARGVMTRLPITLSHTERELALNYVAQHAGLLCNAQQPSLQCNVPGLNLRFQGTLPPLSEGPTFDLRRFSDTVMALEAYVQDGIMSAQQAAQLEWIIAHRKSLLIVGATGSGKTTLVNTLLTLPCIQDDRVLIIEDTPEIQRSIPNSDSLYAKLHVNVRQAVEVALRKNPDRIIVGEVRSGEMALAMLDAGNTGHPGWISTIHADSALKGLHKLDQLTQRVTQASQCDFIASNVDFVAFMQAHGVTRRLVELVRVCGYHGGNFHVAHYDRTIDEGHLGTFGTPYRVITGVSASHADGGCGTRWDLAGIIESD